MNASAIAAFVLANLCVATAQTITEPTGNGFCGGFDLDNNGQAAQCMSNENSQNGESTFMSA
jgi:hypothetical protein